MVHPQHEKIPLKLCIIMRGIWVFDSSSETLILMTGLENLEHSFMPFFLNSRQFSGNAELSKNKQRFSPS